MSDISHKVLETIDKEHVTPKPRWQFLLNRGVIVFLLALSVVLGSLAFAVVLFYLYDFEWDVYYNFSDNRWLLFFLDLPYIWIVVFILFILSVYYHFKHTKQGYRFGFGLTILVAVVLSFAGGVLVYSFSDLPETLDDLAVRNVPFYERLLVTKENRWMRPNMGLLNGMIEEIEEEQEHFTLRDLNDTIWNIDATDLRPPHPPLIVGLRIRLEGHQTSPAEFRVIRILPWFARPPKPRIFPLIKPPFKDFREKVKENLEGVRTNP